MASPCFYLRGIAPKEVRSSDIYWGAIPWVVMQLILVAIVIFWPESVTYWIGGQKNLDPAAIEQKLQQLQLPDMGPPGGLPGFDPAQPPKIE